MKLFFGKKSFLRSLCLLLICIFMMGLCACGLMKKEEPIASGTHCWTYELEESIPSGTHYWTYEMEINEKTGHIENLQLEAEEELTCYLDEYSSVWCKNDPENQSSLETGPIIEISEYQYLGYCFFDNAPYYYDSPVYLIFHVSAVDSTGSETVTKSFYMVSKKLFYETSTPPRSFIAGPEIIEFPSYSVYGFPSLDSVIEMIRGERGQYDISSELHLK